MSSKHVDQANTPFESPTKLFRAIIGTALPYVRPIEVRYRSKWESRSSPKVYNRNHQYRLMNKDNRKPTLAPVLVP